MRGERVSVIAAMTTEGVLDLDIFIDLIERVLLPHLMTFNRFNPNSVVVMDNCSVHHVSGVADVIQEVGALVHYLPPHSPDFNPIELLFSKVKSVIRAMELELSATLDIESIVLAAFSTVTATEYKAWIDSCTLYN